jgi:hypothetical protein
MAKTCRLSQCILFIAECQIDEEKLTDALQNFAQLLRVAMPDPQSGLNYAQVGGIGLKWLKETDKAPLNEVVSILDSKGEEVAHG